MAHSIISPAILYWGTPVALITSQSEDLDPGAPDNICPISSVFWLGHRCVLGFDAGSKTPQNILRTRQCVVNLPSESMLAPVNALARTTGTSCPSPGKLARGYRFVRDKWVAAGLTPQRSDFVRPARIRECPVQMECELAASHSLMEDLPDRAGAIVAMEMKVLRIHVLDSLRMDGHANRVDPDKWRPMIMSFQELYGLGGGKLGDSVLGKIGEEQYRALTRSDVVALLGDNGKELVEEQEQTANMREKEAKDGNA